jgi:hypothetical protein
MCAGLSIQKASFSWIPAMGFLKTRCKNLTLRPIKQQIEILQPEFQAALGEFVLGFFSDSFVVYMLSSKKREE